jgi:ABC-type sugar transport system ATPase subunit
MATIRIKNVTKTFGASEPAVDDLTLTIADGSFTTLLGPSGCGKTTTLRMIAGLEHPTKGEVSIGDTCVFSSETAEFVAAGKRQLGLVFQSYALWPHLTVFENIAFGLRVAKLPRATIKERTDKIAVVLQIEELLGRYPSELSGGQQQRVAIARVLVMEPKVLLLDEPLSNLDAKLRMDMRAELKRLHTEMESTIVYVTHDQIEALTMSTHIALMNRGILQQLARPMELYNAPANMFVADFIGNPRINLFDATIDVDGGGFVARAGSFHVAIPLKAGLARGQKVTLGLRAEDLTVSTVEKPGYAEARVHSVLPTGPEWYLRVISDGKAMTASLQEDLGLEPDDTVWFGAVSERVKCFDANGSLVAGDIGARDAISTSA